MFDDEEFLGKARRRGEQLRPKPSPEQMKYLLSLLIDCGFSNLTQRNAYLSREAGHDVANPDELTKREATLIIGDLKAKRERDRNSRSYTDDDPDWINKWPS